jgi:RimJ/RimL family protein N-acetyltransferase
MAEKAKIANTTPSLTGKSVYLRPAKAEDIANTFHWTLLREPQLLSLSPRPFLTAAEAAEAYKKDEKSADRQAFVIVTIKDNNPVGLIKLLGINELNRSARFSLLSDPEEKDKAHPLEGIHLLCGYLFRYRNLNRVDTLVSTADEDTLRLFTKAGFSEEGTLRQYHFFRGEFFDVKIMAMLLFEYPR